MIAILESITIDTDTNADDVPRQTVTIRLCNAGAFMPTDELQCMVSSIVRVDIALSSAAAALPTMLENPGG